MEGEIGENKEHKSLMAKQSVQPEARPTLEKEIPKMNL